MDRAGSTVAGVATDHGPGLAESFTEVLDEQHAGLDIVGVLHAVDRDPNLCHEPLLLTATAERRAALAGNDRDPTDGW
jgi:hypothetical protein